MRFKKTIKIGLAGNPNSGKTTIFNALTGSNQKVGNYPGVTVEKKQGSRLYKEIEFVIYDLPGTYSLTAYSPDEVVARDFIIDEKPDIVIDVIDSTNLERNLYLCLQLQELGIPVIGALNVMDQARSMGLDINDKELSSLLGIPMVRTVGIRNEGIEELLDRVIECLGRQTCNTKMVSYGNELEDEISKITEVLVRDTVFAAIYPPRWIAIKILEKDRNVLGRLSAHSEKDLVKKISDGCIKEIEKHFGRDSEIVVSEQRYAYVHGAVMESVKRNEKSGAQISEHVDRLLLDRILGLPIFLAVIWAIFQITFKFGEYPMRWLEAFFEWVSRYGTLYIPQGILRSLIVDGVVGGIGSVLSFVPLIIILFFLLSLLEDTGYIARAAFITDKFLHRFGLHGQSFMPMMLGFGCSVPAIMAARTLKNHKDRILTVLITPFMSCGAKLPVYVLLAAAFFPQNAGNVVMSVYVIGVLLALFSSVLLRRLVLRGEETPFVMELPPYRLPTLQGILWHVKEKTWCYMKKAGTVILGASILIWAITTFPVASGSGYNGLEHSIAGRLGKVIEPAIRPIGFDWKIGVAALTGFSAKEVVVSTLGILYKVGDEDQGQSESLREALKNDPGVTPLVGYVLMLFILIMPPCFAALAAMRAEIGGGWLLFSFFYNITLAWVVCFLVYQAGRIAGF